uniref:Putative reverse transcriptase domain-containing protein n=1 Tax=Tanacetum cinerariifolium TaxID=118510 RepID=A0A699GL63_TANCI|nr:putative reverse transcriptase domain-containing protein [Tanacetum cinerariifolium]
MILNESLMIEETPTKTTTPMIATTKTTTTIATTTPIKITMTTTITTVTMTTTNNRIEGKKPSELMLSTQLRKIGMLETFPYVEGVDYITYDLVVLCVTFATRVDVSSHLLSCAYVIEVVERMSEVVRIRRCLRFVGKRTDINARSRRSTKVDESKLCDKPVVYKERHRLRRPMSFGASEDERIVGIIARSDESFGMCIDYHELSKIDLYLSCHQMRVHKDEIPRIDFRMRYGYFELTVMPFGLTNALVVFMELTSRTDGQSEHTFSTLENMFRAGVRNLVVVGILTFCEAEIGESKMIGLELEQETLKVILDDDLDHMIDIMVNEVMIDGNFTCSQVVTVKMIVRKFA